MCGINGILSRLPLEERRNAVSAMNKALAHRGPDNEGLFEDEFLTLGHRRLSIIDLSPAGNQPMSTADKRYTIIYNGELYNFRELKAELKDYPFKTNTDTEVTLAAYAKWGKDCLAKFNGMYAFAIWDTQKKALFLARDRLGIKPLYYFRNEKHFVFSSEMRALLASNLLQKKIDRTSLLDYLKYQTVHAPQTIIKDVKMLEPGHYITYCENNFEKKCYWEISEFNHTSINSKNYGEIKKDVRELFFNSVKKRLVADVPFGAFLSGGIDSSAIVGAMSEVSDNQIKTFSVVFQEEQFSEAKFSKQIAEKFNTEHCEIRLQPHDFLELLPNALKAMDHPSGDGPNTYVVSKVTKEAGITMALSGLGGDELFCGYDIFTRSVKLQSQKWLQTTPLPLRKLAGTLLKTLSPSVRSHKIADLLMLQKFEFQSFYPQYRHVLLNGQIQSLFNCEEETATIPWLYAGNSFPFLSQVSVAEITSYMQNVLLRDTDQMSMAHALEVRVPFLDHELVEYILAVPDKSKFPVTPKKMLIDSLGDLLPSEVVNRPKMGFTFPWEHWMKNELREFCESRINSLSQRNLLNETGLKKHWNSFLKGDKRVTWSRVWPLVVLENWMLKNDIEA
ncbi:MAG: asparagine synthase (glutamine-hydrolyzing) [Flavobacteriales bacterium]|nr:MAG: asparagine synthase (glutamine-hydrolyzing) [Flavobacteriales bacterium]